MNYFFLCALIITLFSSIDAMDCQPQTSSFWAMTTDEQFVEIDAEIAQQSNLLTVLREEYKKINNYYPILLPVNKDDFDFFCSCLTIAAENLLADLNDKDYSKLMDIAEKLKCPIFYAELMEQLLPGNDLCNGFAREQIKTVKLKKAVYKENLEKTCIRESNHNQNNSLFVLYSPDGNYFLENSSTTQTTKEKINLWDTKTLTCIKTFSGYSDAKFSPNSDYVILYTNRDNRIDIPLLFSITHKTEITLLDDHQNYHKYKLALSPDGRYIIQKIKNSHDHISHYTFLDYNTQENTIQNIPLENDWKHVQALCFCSDGKHMLYLTTNGSLIKWKPDDPHKKQEIGRTLMTDCSYITHSNSLLFLSNHHTIKMFTITENEITYIKKLKCAAHDNFHTIFFPRTNIICYNSDNSTLCIVDTKGNKIASHTLQDDKCCPEITILTTNKTGDKCLVSCYDRPDHSLERIVSTIIIWNLSNITTHIPGIKIDTQTNISKVNFTKDRLLITQGHKTELWDMEGDKILSLGKSDCFSLNPHTHSILTAHCPPHYTQCSALESGTQPVVTKIWQSQIDTHKARTILEDIKKSLIPQQALLFNTHYDHTKKQNTTLQLCPNMPDGRALASLKQEHKFITKNFELAKRNFIPKNPPTSQLYKHFLTIPKQETS